MKPSKVICIHIGARAHYLLPKALHRKNNMALLLTDTWVASAMIRKLLLAIPLRLVQSFAYRYSEAISKTSVCSAGIYFACMEIYIRVFYKNDWSRIIARNRLFQAWAKQQLLNQQTYTTVLGISYTSLEVFKIAQEKRKKTILYQMDPGLEEERIVSNLISENQQNYPTSWTKAPKSYWLEWKEECTLADTILVNSDWSKKALMVESIPEEKIQVIPLPFELESQHRAFTRTYPQDFNDERPLVCLFLGTLTLRKGIHIVLEAAKNVIDRPIKFILVGNNELNIDWSLYPNVSYKGVCSRAETEIWYKQSDVFLFPTFSDGFGLTQLEALAWQLPVIASNNCGEVIQDGINGLIMQECMPEVLTEKLENCLKNPSLLKKLSEHCQDRVLEFSIDQFSEKLSLLL